MTTSSGILLGDTSFSLLQVSQGHFGYAALRETMKQVESRIVG